jgi:hypothetical protein
MNDDGLVPVFLSVAIRTSGGNGPVVVRVPPDEAGRIIGRRHGVYGEHPPRGFEDGGIDARTLAGPSWTKPPP